MKRRKEELRAERRRKLCAVGRSEGRAEGCEDGDEGRRFVGR